MAHGEQGDELLLTLLVKLYPDEMTKKSMEGAGFNLLRNMEDNEAIQFRSILHLPINTYKRMQRIMINFRYDEHFFHHIIVLLWNNKNDPTYLQRHPCN